MVRGVSSRTRSKNAPLFVSFPLDGLSSSKLKRSRENYYEDDPCSKKTRVKEEPFVLSENIEVICIDDDDDDGGDGDGDGDEKIFEGDSDAKRKVGSDESGGIDGFDAKKEVESDEVGGSRDEFGDKDENGIKISDDGSEFESESDDDDESEECETSDEEYQVNEVHGISDSDYSDDEKEEKPGWRKYHSVVEELVREVKDEKSRVLKSNNIEEVEIDQNRPSSVHSHVSLDDDVDDESVNIVDSDEGHERCVRGLGVEGVSLFQRKQEKMGDSDKHTIMENKEKGHEGSVNIGNGEKMESMDSNDVMNQRDNNTLFLSKELHSVKRLAEFYWGDKPTVKNDPIVWEEKSDVVDQRPPPVCVEAHPLIWSLKKVKKLQKTKEEQEEEVLWAEMHASLREQQAESMIGNLGTKGKMASPFSLCEHDTILNEEIGVYCKLCGFVVTDIKDISPPVVDRFPHKGSRKKASFDNSVNVSCFDGSQFNVPDGGDSEANHFSHDTGTVWDLVPDVKQTLYPHQQEGFEFIWKNLAGNIDLHELKNTDPSREGGCIISHAPGTGKTRLTIVFLIAYLKLFPECHPVIVAPASLLLTWEDEFKKWDIGVPFHNFNNLELSNKEYEDALNADHWYNLPHSKDTTRKAKLISWFKEKSIMGISYHLYEKLVRGGGDIGKVLREIPGLLVLDEGHTPRNQRSRIWKVFSTIQTKKRIILSGTPFQNNFYELYNTLSLVKPSFPNTIPYALKKFCQKQEKTKKTSKEWSWEPINDNTTENPSGNKIMQLKFLMDPFVHVHKGTILQKKLPGLRDCVLALKPDSLQRQVLESIQSSQNTIIYEQKLTLASVHPSLLLECGLLEEEESVIDKNRLEKLRLNPYGGVKTKFLVEFVRLCDAVNEKVLVFSQFLRPLSLIKDQLNLAFNWSEGKEMLYMDGKIDLKDRQSLIRSFNDENCQAKILLASTKACSEGISLVGASRVVLLDVVWNPSVEQQAISRAYRIGQKKVVYTYHLLTQGTTEYLKYCKQAEKDQLSRLVFSTKNTDNDESKSCEVEFEDRVLDQMKQHEKLKDMFAECGTAEGAQFG